MIEATHGAYTAADLWAMPVHDLFDLWGAVAFRNTQTWLATAELDEYKPQERGGAT